jgi:hypothetical protein
VRGTHAIPRDINFSSPVSQTTIFALDHDKFGCFRTIHLAGDEGAMPRALRSFK